VGWAALSDSLGRKKTMFVCSLSLPACLAMPFVTEAAVSGEHGTAPLYLFYGLSFSIVTW
jgi:hypothetical protein